MLVRSLVIAAIAAVVAIQLPAWLGTLPEGDAPERATAEVPQAVPQALPAPPGGMTTLQADAHGHYNGSFRINGKPVDGMIDTGASLVALPESVARRLGYGASALDFRHPVNTANGQTKAALIELDRVEIGPVRVRGVRAAVLKDSALSSALIGMSFLGQLNSYRVENGAMKLYP